MTTCPNHIRNTSLSYVSAFPRNPVISGNVGLILGEENILTCKVSHVYPSEFLEVELLQGDKVLQTEEGEPNTDGLLISHNFRPSSEDDGNAVTCRASLNMDGIPSDEMTRESSAHMSVLCKFKIRLNSHRMRELSVSSREYVRLIFLICILIACFHSCTS